MNSIKFLFFIVLFSVKCFANSKDYLSMSFLDQNLRLGVTYSYSKLEANSDIGNYYLLSAANPRIDLAYESGVNEMFHQRFSFYFLRELFRPENDALRIKSKNEQNNYGLAWQPMWVSEGGRASYGLKLGLKAATIISELPNPYTVDGDIATRYSGEAGAAFNWFGLTVSKFPLNIGFEIVYSQNLYDNSVVTYYNGFIYRFSFEFDIKKKTLFSGWNLKGYYSYENLDNSYSHFVDKEIGLTVNRVFTF